jgi:hypothetical protein
MGDGVGWGGLLVRLHDLHSLLLSIGLLLRSCFGVFANALGLCVFCVSCSRFEEKKFIGKKKNFWILAYVALLFAALLFCYKCYNIN